jgi:hypothetical protein
MGGKEAARYIRSFDLEARLIVSSGYSDDPVMAEHEKYGFYAAIAKPYRPDEVAKVLNSLKQLR